MKPPFVLAILLLFHSIFSFAQVPVYSSFPSAPATVFLDFDGHKTEGTSWNRSGAIICGPANLNAAQITQIFNRVAEDYRPFNINITTDSTKYWGAPYNKRIRVVLTITSDWYGNNVGGISYVGSFTWGDYSPAFIFTALLKYDVKSIAEAVSHEVGHTLGLRHQAAYDTTCKKTSDYNMGNGLGETGWAPIMGLGYYHNYTLWHNGANPYGCTNIQDDLGIISGAVNGFGYRADDYAASFETAAATAIYNNQFSATGIIATATDEDMFQVKVPATGRFQLNAVPYNVGAGNAGANLDIQVKLYDQGQKLIATYNPPDVLNATIDTTLPAGTYYYLVSGAGNQYASGYASLGSYAIQGIFAGLPPLLLEQLKLQGTSEIGWHKLNWIIDSSGAVQKQLLEVSDNGIDFKPLALLDNTGYNYIYAPAADTPLQYRLMITFNNGRQYFSNTIILGNTMDDATPYLSGTLVQNNTLKVNSPSAGFTYAIMDYTGKMIGSGRLIQGNNVIQTSYISNGIYLIQYSNNKGSRYVQKFIKQ